MGSLVLVLVAFGLLVMQSALATFVPFFGYTPNLMLPIALFLGVTAEVHIVRGALTTFFLGCMLDSFCGGAIGLQTFVLMAMFLLARGAGVRLLAQGPLVQFALCFVAAIGFGAAVIALRAVFEEPLVGTFDPASAERIPSLLRASIATAFAAPLVLVLTSRIELLGTFKREKRTLSG